MVVPEARIPPMQARRTLNNFVLIGAPSCASPVPVGAFDSVPHLTRSGDHPEDRHVVHETNDAARYDPYYRRWANEGCRDAATSSGYELLHDELNEDGGADLRALSASYLAPHAAPSSAWGVTPLPARAAVEHPSHIPEYQHGYRWNVDGHADADDSY
ncbi:hypothetical protein GY45DRAFT_1319250 [Cubamyces sp. BRFM 1775]|nr:hypothetical protein GY45DRAFT_1319250 [Cubamyces sp. BRFM 1775]